MDFLKDILGDELYKEFETKVKEYNTANKDKAVKIADLSTGDYVAKAKYQSELTAKTKEIESANELVENLRKEIKENAEAEKLINDYKSEVEKLKEDLASTNKNSAIKTLLLKEKCVDVDYVMFKLNEKLTAEKKSLEVDENGKIDGWKEVMEGLKTQMPKMFEETNQGFKPVGGQKIPGSGGNEGYTRDDLLRMPYAKRNELFEKNPEEFRKIMSEV